MIIGRGFVTNKVADRILVPKQPARQTPGSRSPPAGLCGWSFSANALPAQHEECPWCESNPRSHGSPSPCIWGAVAQAGAARHEWRIPDTARHPAHLHRRRPYSGQASAGCSSRRWFRLRQIPPAPGRRSPNPDALSADMLAIQPRVQDDPGSAASAQTAPPVDSSNSERPTCPASNTVDQRGRPPSADVAPAGMNRCCRMMGARDLPRRQ